MSTAICGQPTRCWSIPRTVPGLSDGGAHCTMIVDFDYPTFLLGYWVATAPADLRLPVESVVKQQSADTAARWSVLRPWRAVSGQGADVNLVALSEIGSTFPTIVDDLPGVAPGLSARGTGYVAPSSPGKSPSRAGPTTARWRELWHAADGCEHCRVGP